MLRECHKYLLRGVIVCIVTQNTFGIRLCITVPQRLLLSCNFCRTDVRHDCWPDPALPALLHCQETLQFGTIATLLCGALCLRAE